MYFDDNRYITHMSILGAIFIIVMLIFVLIFGTIQQVSQQNEIQSYRYTGVLHLKETYNSVILSSEIKKAILDNKITEIEYDKIYSIVRRIQDNEAAKNKAETIRKLKEE